MSRTGLWTLAIGLPSIFVLSIDAAAVRCHGETGAMAASAMVPGVAICGCLATRQRLGSGWSIVAGLLLGAVQLSPR